jgi:hypothetical protein
VAASGVDVGRDSGVVVLAVSSRVGARVSFIGSCDISRVGLISTVCIIPRLHR